MADEGTKPSEPARGAGHISMSEEMDSAKWTLPPVAPVLMVLLVLAALVGGVAWLLRPKPTSAGAITGVFAATTPDRNNVMVLLHVRVTNQGKKPLWIRNIKAQLKTDQGEWSDDAASAVDYARYFQALPELGQHQIGPLRPETKIPPGGQQEGMVLVSFPVNKEAFEKRKSLAVTIENYDQRPTVIVEGSRQ